MYVSKEIASGFVQKKKTTEIYHLGDRLLLVETVDLMDSRKKLKWNLNTAKQQGSGRSGSYEITKLPWARIAALCNATGERSPCTELVPPKLGKREKLVTSKARLSHTEIPAEVWYTKLYP